MPRSAWKRFRPWKSWARASTAMHDLEIRGTGEVLGDSQSGNIQEVGFSMYNEMLNEAVRCARARNRTWTRPSTACEVNLHAPALLPSDYCADVHARRPSTSAGARGRRRRPDPDPEELIDRFGKLPDAAQTLLTTHRLRLAAQPLGIVKIDASETQALLQFGPKTPVDPARIIELVQRQRHIKLAGGQAARRDQGAADPGARRRRACGAARAEAAATPRADATDPYSQTYDYSSPCRPIPCPDRRPAEQLAALAQAQGVARISATAARLLDVQHDDATRAEVRAWGKQGHRCRLPARRPETVQLQGAGHGHGLHADQHRVHRRDRRRGGRQDKVSEITEAAMRGEIRTSPKACAAASRCSRACRPRRWNRSTRKSCG